MSKKWQKCITKAVVIQRPTQKWTQRFCNKLSLSYRCSSNCTGDFVIVYLMKNLGEDEKKTTTLFAADFRNKAVNSFSDGIVLVMGLNQRSFPISSFYDT